MLSVMPVVLWIRSARDGLAEACDSCTSRRFGTVEELLTAQADLSALPQLPVIITKKSLHEIEASGLADLARRKHWPVVVRLDLDPPSEIVARGWLALPSPFSRLDLVLMVDELLGLYPLAQQRRA